MGTDEPPFQIRTFLKTEVALVLNVSKYNSLHRLNTVENPSTHIALIQSPVKSSANKIIYAVGLIHVMLSRSIFIWQFFKSFV